MLLIGIRKGGVKCSSACPFYTERGVVRGCNDVPLKTHCRMVMNPWIVDCEVYDTYQIDKLEVTEEQWKQMQHAVHKRATRQRKLYPEQHEEIHHIGENTRETDKWNAQKSDQAKIITNYRQLKQLKSL